MPAWRRWRLDLTAGMESNWMLLVGWYRRWRSGIFLGILFPSAIFQGRHPEGGALLSVFIGGMRNPEVYAKDDETLKAIAIHEIRIHCSVPMRPIWSKSSLSVCHPAIWADSLSPAGSHRKNRTRLILAGNIRDGIGMADRVKQERLPIR